MIQKEQFFRSGFSVDNVIFAYDSGDLIVLLIKRAEEPFKDQWALPGALVRIDEDLRAAPQRVLEELTGLENVYLEQVKTFGKVDRHPVGRVITVAYYSLIDSKKVNPVASSFAKTVEWHKVKDIERMAFDHMEIMDTCLEKLKTNLSVRPIGFELLPQKFTLSELQGLYEAVLGYELDKRNFRKKFLSMQILVDVHEYQQGVAHRPAKLYQFDSEKYERFVEEGFNFEI